MFKKFFATVTMLAVMAGLAAQASAQDWDKGVSLFNQKQYREAIREFHAVLRANPEYWKAWYYIGAGHFHLQGYQNAIDAFQNYIKGAESSEKDQVAGYYFTGFSHYQLKQYDKAIPALGKYISLSEKNQVKIDANARAALGRSYIFAERFNEAIPVLAAAAAEMKTDANNHYYIGFAQHKLKRDDQAIPALNQALAINSKDVDSLSLLGNIYLARWKENPNMLKQAISTGERLRAIEDGERAWSLLGQAYLLDKQYAKAAPPLDKFARAHPDSGGAWYNLGVAYSRSSQWKPAAEALEQAVKLAPKNVVAYLELGYIYESDKLPAKALSAYERAYEASGRRDETARAAIERLKQSKPS
ncbi:MAG: tetratricopeptide repeat protein [Blastocatellia bacterium]|nr:tetratricopeptide repeat protein [Blastocatellia bacterium]